MNKIGGDLFSRVRNQLLISDNFMPPHCPVMSCSLFDTSSRVCYVQYHPTFQRLATIIVNYSFLDGQLVELWNYVLFISWRTARDLHYLEHQSLVRYNETWTHLSLAFIWWDEDLKLDFAERIKNYTHKKICTEDEFLPIVSLLRACNGDCEISWFPTW